MEELEGRRETARAQSGTCYLDPPSRLLTEASLGFSATVGNREVGKEKGKEGSPR
jgi:hypothetical protein